MTNSSPPATPVSITILRKLRIMITYADVGAQQRQRAGQLPRRLQNVLGSLSEKFAIHGQEMEVATWGTRGTALQEHGRESQDARFRGRQSSVLGQRVVERSRSGARRVRSLRVRRRLRRTLFARIASRFHAACEWRPVARCWFGHEGAGKRGWFREVRSCVHACSSCSRSQSRR
jgi:hypothetical protein